MGNKSHKDFLERFGTTTRDVATRVWSFDGTRLTDFDGPFIEWEDDRARRSAKAVR